MGNRRPAHDQLPRRGVGCPRTRRPTALRVSRARGRTSGPFLAHSPEETRELSDRVRPVRPGESCRLWSQGSCETPPQPGNHPEPPQDHLDNSECEGVPRGPERVRDLRPVHVDVCWRPTQSQSMEEHGANSRKDEGVGRDERRLATSRILFRRIDHLLRAHAGRRDGQRSYRPLFSLPQSMRAQAYGIPIPGAFTRRDWTSHLRASIQKVPRNARAIARSHWERSSGAVRRTDWTPGVVLAKTAKRIAATPQRTIRRFDRRPRRKSGSRSERRLRARNTWPRSQVTKATVCAVGNATPE